MSDWSNYFEHFPEKNPANWVDGKYDPRLAERLLEDKHHDDMNHEKSNDESKEIIETAKQEAKTHSLLLVEDSSDKPSPKNLNTHKLNEYFTDFNAKIAGFMDHWHFP